MQYHSFLDGELEYEAVAASATDQVLGATGGVGDFLSHLIIAPTSGTPGTIVLKDGTTTILTLTPPASSQPFTQVIGVNSATGAWKVTTGSAVTVLAVGNFT